MSLEFGVLLFAAAAREEQSLWFLCGGEVACGRRGWVRRESPFDEVGVFGDGVDVGVASGNCGGGAGVHAEEGC